MFTVQFWRDLFERAVATFAQAFLATMPADSLPSTHLPWGTKVALAGIAAGLSALKSLAGTQMGAPDSGSWLPAADEPPQPNAYTGQAEVANAGRARRRRTGGYALIMVLNRLSTAALLALLVVWLVR